MRRFLLPALVLAVVVAASILASSANNTADPGDPSSAAGADSLGSPILNVRRVPEWLRQPTTDNTLERAVTSALANAGAGSTTCLSVHRDGTPIAEVDANVALVPGALHRLLVLAALDGGSNAGFTTEVVRSTNTEVIDGVLQGDLWIIGRSDPVLSTSPFADQLGAEVATTSIVELALLTAQALADAEITAITGSVIGVDQRYDGSPRSFPVAGWPASAEPGNEVGGISSLLVNNGFTEFPLEGTDDDTYARASNPTSHAASVFRDVLIFAEVGVGGRAVAGEAPAATDRVAVASINSPPLSEIARRALIDATTAEMLYREVAVRNARSTSDVIDMALGLRSALEANGFASTDEVGLVVSFDGSGTSPKDQATCGIVTTILDASDGLATASLPPADASIIRSCTPAGLTSLNVIATARTDVTALAGRAEASNGDIITFSVIANAGTAAGAEPLSGDACAGLLPALLDAIASHPAGPTLAELEPLPAVAAE